MNKVRWGVVATLLVVLGCGWLTGGGLVAGSGLPGAGAERADLMGPGIPELDRRAGTASTGGETGAVSRTAVQPGAPAHLLADLMGPGIPELD